jgi:hypothetical protein
MADLVRAEDLDVGTRIYDPAGELIKVDLDCWRWAGSPGAGEAGDRQVNILLDTGATLAPAEQPTT